MLPKNRVTAHPGQILQQEFLQPLRITQAALASKLGCSKNRRNELVRGKRGITANTALLLARFFRNSPEFWMNLQSMHDLSRATAARRRKTAVA